MVLTAPLDEAHGLIGAGTGVSEVRAKCGDGQHATTAGGQLSVLCGRGAGVEHVHVFEGVRLVDAGDDIALGGGGRVVLCGHDDGDGRFVCPFQRRQLRQFAGCSGVQDSAERAGQTLQNSLGFGIAEAGVELDDLNAVLRQCQTAVQQPHKRGSAASHFIDDRLRDLRNDVLDQTLGSPRQGSVGAHAAGVGALVAVECALEVLRGSQRDRRGAVAQNEQRHLGAVKEVLNDNPVGLSQTGAGVCQSLVSVRCDDNALARGQTVGLDDVRGAEAVKGLFAFGQGPRGDRLRCGNPGGLHDLLGKGLRTFELRGGSIGAKDSDPSLPQSIANAGNQGRFRADDHEVNSEFLCESHDRLGIGHRHTADFAFLCHPRVAGCRVERVHSRIGGQTSDKGVFAGARTQNQDLHTRKFNGLRHTNSDVTSRWPALRVERMQTFTADSAEELAVVSRSDFVESRHIGSAVIVDPSGAVVASIGAPEEPVFVRSCLKPLQAIACMELGVPLSGDAAVVASASHRAEAEHVSVVKNMLSSVNLNEDDLQCPSCAPADADNRAAMRMSGMAESRLFFNCSGKHAAFLMAQKIAGGRPEDYLRPDSLVQKQVRKTVEEFCGEVPAAAGIDGCGAPVYALSLPGLARGIAAAASGRTESAQQLMSAVLASPWAIEGHGRENSVVIERLGILAKKGAEGVSVMATPDGWAAAVKVLDGSSRPASLVALRLLAAAGAVNMEAALGVLSDIAPRVTGGADEHGRALDAGEVLPGAGLLAAESALTAARPDNPAGTSSDNQTMSQADTAEQH